MTRQGKKCIANAINQEFVPPNYYILGKSWPHSLC